MLYDIELGFAILNLSEFMCSISDEKYDSAFWRNFTLIDKC